ncbi:hypothetical protein CerSpe_113960 [Prunus speciosa]
MGLKRQKSLILLGGLAKVLDGQESNGFEQLIEPLKHHRCVITVYHLFLFIYTSHISLLMSSYFVLVFQYQITVYLYL